MGKEGKQQSHVVEEEQDEEIQEEEEEEEDAAEEERGDDAEEDAEEDADNDEGDEEAEEKEGGEDGDEEAKNGESTIIAATSEGKEQKEGEEASKAKGLQKQKEKYAIKLGAKVFYSQKQIAGYLSKVLQLAPVDEKLNDEAAQVVIELVTRYHPTAQQKIGPGLDSVVVRVHGLHDTKCFFLVKKDGTEEDVSFRKCIDNISSRRVVKFSGLEPGTPYQTVKDAFFKFGKCFLEMREGETKGLVKYGENEFCKKLIDNLSGGTLKIEDTDIVVEYLTDDEEREFWENQKKSAEKARMGNLNKEKSGRGKADYRGGRGGRGHGGRGGGERGRRGHNEGQKGEKRKQEDQASGENPKKQKGNKIEFPSRGR